MADKDDIMREDDSPEDKGGQQQQPQQQSREDAPVLRPIDDLPPIRRGNERQEQKPEYEIIEVDDNDQPLGGDDRRRGDEENLSEAQGGERTLLDQQRQEEERKTQRESSRERRERKKQARERDRTENVQLRRDLAAMRDELDQFKTGAEKRLNAVDAGRIQGELARLDAEIDKQKATIATTEMATRKAMGENDADSWLAAQNQREEAVIKRARLEGQKENLKSRIEASQGARDDGGDDRRDEARPQRQEARDRRPLVGAAKRYADEFQHAYDWVNPNSRDPEEREDAELVLFLDGQITRQGYDPGTQEYWDALEDKMRELLPHRFDEEEDGRRSQTSPRQQSRQNGRSVNGNANGRTQNTQQQQPQQRRGPPLADVGGRGSNARKTQVKISPERKRALIETGSLGADGRVIDQGKLDRQLQRFAEFDARESAGR
jgi:hypothetical protein